MVMLGLEPRVFLTPKVMLLTAASGAQGAVWEGQARWGTVGLPGWWSMWRLWKRGRKIRDHLVSQF